MSLTARFASVCADCDGRINVGDLIEGREMEWAHATCPEDLHLPDVVPPACPDCFMVLPCTCGYFEGGGQ